MFRPIRRLPLVTLLLSTVLALAADPGAPGTLYAGTDGGDVWKSTDGDGPASRTGLSTAHIKALSFDPVRPRTLYAVAEALGVHRSTDAGRTWTRINARLPATDGYGVDVNTVAADPTRPGVLFASTGGGGLQEIRVSSTP